MARVGGCLKRGCLGCLGLIAVFLLLIGVMALLAMRDNRNSQPRDEKLTPLEAQSGVLSSGQPGTVKLDLTQGNFGIHRAEPGEGLHIDAVYDDNLYDLSQNFSVQADSTWQYELHFFRTRNGMRAFLQGVFAKGPSTRVDIYLPPDMPVDLITDVSKGGLNADLGGLWLRSADFHTRQGGFALDISEPLREPVSTFSIDHAMGGLAVDRIGNASPRKLNIASRMGGSDLGLGGAWLNNCDVNLAVKMGGMSVRTPDDVTVLRSGQSAPALANTDVETPKPVLRFHSSANYGDIKFSH